MHLNVVLKGIHELLWARESYLYYIYNVCLLDADGVLICPLHVSFKYLVPFSPLTYINQSQTLLYISCVSLRCWRCAYLSITCLLQISGSVFTFNIYTPISNTTISIQSGINHVLVFWSHQVHILVLQKKFLSYKLMILLLEDLKAKRRICFLHLINKLDYFQMSMVK